MKHAIFLVLVFPVLSGAFSQSTQTCSQWETATFEFSVKRKVQEPFDVKFGAVLRHTDGYTMDVPGFYNGNNSWLIRFNPQLTGEWNYLTYSQNQELSGKSGQLLVTESKDASQHGPITISQDDPSKFIYADGTPYFLLAFELDWLFALDAENPDDIPKARQIINQVKENGFNQIVMNVYAYDAGWGEKDKIPPKYNFAQPKVFPFLGTNENPDYSSLAIDYFKRFDRVMDYLNEQGIVAHLMIYVWNKKVNWPEPYSEADNRYFDYVVKRYQAYPNLIWDISKEALAYGRDDMGYISERIHRLRQLDGHQRLVSVHDITYCSAFPEKVDFISIQNWSPNIYSIMRETREKYAGKPVFNIEHGGYEKTTYSIFDGSYTDPLVCLDRNYQCLFAGTYSTYYWQNTSWYNVIYEPEELPISEQPAFAYYRYLADFFRRFNFNELEPIQNLSTPFGLADREKLYLFYVPAESRGVFGELAELKEKGIELSWYDPLTGNYSEVEKKEMKGTWMGFRKPANQQNNPAIAVIEVK